MNTSWTNTLLIRLVLAGISLSAWAQDSVDVNLNYRHSVGGVSTFVRSNYIVLHSSLTDSEWDSETRRNQFYVGYDVYMGRNNGTMPWELSQTQQDPAKPGWPRLSHMQTRGNSAKSSYASQTVLHQYESRSGNMIGGQWPMYPNGQTNGLGWALTNHAALAEFMANHLTYNYGSGGATGEPRPTQVEVMNEIFFEDGHLGTTKSNLSYMHKVVADRIHQLHPSVMVGGHSAGWPGFEESNFGYWNDGWKVFMDVAGTNMDFFAQHIYDNWVWNPTTNWTWNSVTEQPRRGANTEAVLDMLEHYSFLKFGVVKPLNISEYGFFSPQLDGYPYSKERDWLQLRAYSPMMMQFMARPNVILKAIPFLLIRASWYSHPSGYPYGSRLLRRQNEVPGEVGTNWTYTELVKFFQLWSDVKGTRVDSHPSDPDLLVDAYVNGTNAFVIINNLNFTNRTVQLNLFGTANPVLSVSVKHLYASNNIPMLDSFQTNAVTQVTVATNGTMILKYNFASPLVVDQIASEAKYYGDAYLQPIVANVPAAFNLNGVSRSSPYGEAVLRLGLGRDHSFSLQPTVLFNGSALAVPADWPGDNQLTRARFFGVIEIPVPYALLQTNNTVSVRFNDTGGHISSLALQVHQFTGDLRPPASPYLPFAAAQKIGPNFVLTVTNGPSNGYFTILSTTNLASPVWATNETGLPLNASGVGFYTNLITGNQRFFVALRSDPPPVAVTGVTVFPTTLTVSPGGTAKVVTVVSPTNATNPSLTWTSSVPARATVNAGGVITGVSAGATTITARTVDGNYPASCTVTVGTSTPGISFDSTANYQNKVFTAGSNMLVRCTYNAGPSNTVTSAQGGIKYFLRELTSSYGVVRDVIGYDSAAIGTQSGGSALTLQLPADLTPTASLPPGNFYYLFLLFNSSNGTNYNVSTQPIIIVTP